MLQRGILLPIHSAESRSQTCFVLAQVGRAFSELFNFPTSTGPKAASIAFFPTVFFIESSFHKPSSHLASRHSPLSTLSPPTWPWARKSIKLLITGGGCRCRCRRARAELLTQQVSAPSQPPWVERLHCQAPGWDLFHITLSGCGWLPLHPRIYSS